jgi:hypothetical protein
MPMMPGFRKMLANCGSPDAMRAPWPANANASAGEIAENNPLRNNEITHGPANLSNQNWSLDVPNGLESLAFPIVQAVPHNRLRGADAAPTIESFEFRGTLESLCV